MITGSRSSRLAAAITVVVVLTVCGAALGAVWAWIAPPIHTVTALTRSGERVDAFLGTEADNLFVAAAMLIGLLVVQAIVAAVAVWQWRAGHGPLQIAVQLLLPAAVAALTYSLMAVATPRDDLGGWPVMDPRRPQAYGPVGPQH